MDVESIKELPASGSALARTAGRDSSLRLAFGAVSNLTASVTRDARAGIFVLVAAVLAVGALLVTVSQSAFAFGDEGFHLLASQLINQGKRPYLDFFYQHTPLYIYANALWMRCFGDTWRSAHLFSALLTLASAGMIAVYVYSRIQRPSRFIWATAAAIFYGTNVLVTRHTLLGMPSALFLSLIVGAFLVTVSGWKLPYRAFWAGLLSSAAFGVSLLSAPVAPILLAWLLWHAGRNRRWKTFLWFAVGGGISALPLVWLFFQAPAQMGFDTVAYQLWWRSTGLILPGKPLIKIASELLHSPQGVVLLLLSLGGVFFVFSTMRGEGSRLKSELRLCIILAVVLITYISLAPRPIYPQYFLNVIPFAVILATAGMLALGTQILPRLHSVCLVGAVIGVFLLAGVRSAREHIRRPEKSWIETEKVAAFINEITPPDLPIYTSDGAIHFVARRIPATGFENNYAFELHLPADQQKLLRIVDHQQIYASVAQGKFGAAIAWSPKEAASLKLDSFFAERRDFPGHYVYWEWDGLSEATTP